MPTTNPHREEILALLRHADCHYGNALRDAECGLTVDEAADKRKVGPIGSSPCARQWVGWATANTPERRLRRATRTGCSVPCCTSAARCPTGYVSTSTPGLRGSRRNSCPT